jgi:hypothetical protein
LKQSTAPIDQIWCSSSSFFFCLYHQRQRAHDRRFACSAHVYVVLPDANFRMYSTRRWPREIRPAKHWLAACLRVCVSVCPVHLLFLYCHRTISLGLLYCISVGERGVRPGEYCTACHFGGVACQRPTDRPMRLIFNKSLSLV